MHIYIQCTRRGWDEIFMYLPPKPEPEKCGMVWVEIKVLQENMMNNTKCWWELEWTSAWGKIDGIHHYIIAKQHPINIVYPLTYLTWIVKWRNPSWCDDGRIQVRQVAWRTIFGMIPNCVFISSLQLQHTWRPDRLNPQDSVTRRNV